MTPCPACTGLVPAHRATCPHCDAAVRRGVAATILQLLGAGACAVTLMACYGAMPHHADHAQPRCDDGDRDGACVPQDCNDADAAAYPGAADPDLDGVDQNCDGVDGWRDPAAVAAPPPS